MTATDKLSPFPLPHNLPAGQLLLDLFDSRPNELSRPFEQRVTASKPFTAFVQKHQRKSGSLFNKRERLLQTIWQTPPASSRRYESRRLADVVCDKIEQRWYHSPGLDQSIEVWILVHGYKSSVDSSRGVSASGAAGPSA